MAKTLVVYYSMQNHTRRIAEMIVENMGADTLRIKPKRDYNMATSLTMGRSHINKKHSPELRDYDFDPDQYDRIVIGSPVWWFTFAPPLRSFLEQNDLSGKTIAAFCTHGGGPGNTLRDLGDMAGSLSASRDFQTGAGPAGKMESFKPQVDSWVAKWDS